jgi:hypothetical protein
MTFHKGTIYILLLLEHLFDLSLLAVPHACQIHIYQALEIFGIEFVGRFRWSTTSSIVDSIVKASKPFHCLLDTTVYFCLVRSVHLNRQNFHVWCVLLQLVYRPLQTLRPKICNCYALDSILCKGERRVLANASVSTIYRAPRNSFCL